MAESRHYSPMRQCLSISAGELTDNRWKMKLNEPIDALAEGMLTVSIKDRQGNIGRIERKFSVARQPLP